MILGQWGTLGVFGSETPPLTLPTVIASVTPSSVLRGDAFTLDASASSNVDTYLWEQLSGGDVVLTSSTDPITTQNAPAENIPDTLVFRVTGTNGEGSATASVSVDVRPRLKARKVIRVNGD